MKLHTAIKQMKKTAKGSMRNTKDMTKDAHFLNKTEIAAFVWLTRPHGTNLFPADGAQQHWRTIFCNLHNFHTQNGEPIKGHIFENGKLRQATIRQCHSFLALHNGEGRR